MTAPAEQRHGIGRNAAANLGGRLWLAGLAAVLVPFYVRMLGVEAYALVGIGATLHALFALLDLGMSAAVSRELARLEARGSAGRDGRDLIATFECLFLILAAAVALVVALAAPLVATRWIRPQALPTETIVSGLRLIGISVGLQLPTTFYMAGLLGLQRQVLYNVIAGSVATARGLGAIAVLLVYGPSVRAFFGWQLLISVAATAALGVSLHRIVDAGRGRGALSAAPVRHVGRYAAGWSGYAVVRSLGLHADKVVLSRLLPLGQLGYYTLASAVPVLLWNLVYSVSAATLPRFNRSVAQGEARLGGDYLFASQLVATLLLPAAALVVAFPRETLWVWTGDAAIAAAAAPLVILLAAGMTLAGLANPAQNVAFALGRFRLPLAIAAATTLVSVPLMILAARAWGAVGGALVWALQAGAMILLAPLVQRRHFPGLGLRWLLRGVLLPALVTGVVCVLARTLLPENVPRGLLALYLAAAWACATAGVAAVLPDVGRPLLRLLRSFTGASAGPTDP